MDSTPAILTRGLSKDYGKLLALNAMDLRVEQGEIFGFLGPNGAGKTTAIRLLLDLIRPTGGSAAILGMDCQRESTAVRAVTGYLPGDVRTYSNLSGRQTVELIGGMRPGGVDWREVGELAGDLALDLDRRAGTYSKGNRQKLGIVLAMLGNPRVLLLDEPTSGLDPIVQHVFWDILRRQAARGTTVFFSSHVISEVDEVCQRVGILRQGRLVAVQPVAAMKGRSVRHVEVSFDSAPPPASEFAVDGIRELRRDGATLEFEVAGEIDPLLKALARYHVIDLRTAQPTLDEILLRYYREGVA